MTEPGAFLSGSRFGLQNDPFAHEATETFFYSSGQHQRTLEFMARLLWSKANAAVVIAAQGCGKSRLVRQLLSQLDRRVLAAAVQREHGAGREFLLDILRQFGFALEEHDRTDRRRLLERFLQHQAASGRMCLLAVENPQSMHPSVLEELRHLASLQLEGEPTLKLLLLGQPSLMHVLGSPRMAPLGLTDSPRITLAALSEDETAGYIAHRLRAAGAANPDDLLPATLLSRIHAYSLGIPAEINRVCAQALACAARAGAMSVTVAALEAAAGELGVKQRHGPEPITSGERAGLPLQQRSAQLLISIQGLADRAVRLEGDRVLLGRGEEADVRIDSVFVSRYHALIIHDGGRDLLLDLGSTNGLLVNSQRIFRCVLQDRDLIQVGAARVTYINEHLTAQPDPGQTVCFTRGAAPAAAGEDGTATILGFGRLDQPA